MTKIRKNSKVKLWNIYSATGDFLGEYSFYREEVKAYFPDCEIKKRNVVLK